MILYVAIAEEEKRRILQQIQNNMLAICPGKRILYRFRDGLKQSVNNCVIVTALSSIWFADNNSFDFSKLSDREWGLLVRKNMTAVLVGYLVGMLK